EVVARNLDAHGDQVVEEAWAYAGRLEMPDHAVVRPGPGAHELEYLLHLDDVALESRDLGNRRHLALAVGEARELHDEPDRGGDLASNGGDGHRQSRHTDQLLETRDRLTRIVGVNGRHRAFVAGVHRLQHVEGL